MYPGARCKSDRSIPWYGATLEYNGATVVVGGTGAHAEQPLFGDVVRYELLCRAHYRTGELGE